MINKNTEIYCSFAKKAGNVGCKLFNSSFNYYDTLFTSHKIGEIIQLQRSYFGQHKLKDKKNNIFIPKWVKK